MKINKLKAVLCLIFTLGLCIPASTFLYLKASTASKEDKPVFPKWNELYGKDLVEYLEKTFPFRGDWIEYGKKIDGNFLKKFNKFLEKISDGKYLIPRSENKVIFGKQDWLFYESSNSVSYYRGSNILTEKEMEDYYNSLIKLKDACDEKKINLVIMCCPNKENVYSQYMPSFSIVDEYKRLPRLNDYLKNKGINFLYPINILKNGEFRSYHMQDTHCNKYGGYLIYKIAMESISRSFGSTGEILKIEKTGGDLSAMCGLSSVYEDYELPNYRKERTYTLDPDEKLNEVAEHSLNNDGENNCYFVGDSFRHYLKEFIFKDFKEAFITNKTYITNNYSKLFIKKLSPGDCVFIEAVERHDSELCSIANSLAPIIRSI